ncbi:DUF882 domain-containing protein [Azospirillum agricola]|uniref:DUF882 domain-containing protein n=1 Tax=Azospirillum agricola TaxID=1720247 RepID=UPI000A0F311C|nr:DUF882 domain-containing protein [Azospirillum agricola]SMH58473.1 Uncharacterized conserved protein YcbK, DUF882 family [Azospirillum lipoferum]
MLLGDDERAAPAMGRRGFLGFAAAALSAAVPVVTGAVTAAPVLLGSSAAEAAPLAGPIRRIALHNINTNDRFDGVYWADGNYKADALRKLDVLLRDHRAKQVCRYDPRLFDLLARVHQSVGSDDPFEVICGFRSRRTNAMARRRSRGVAKESYHTRGMAIDIRLPDAQLRGIAETAKAMHVGGVGYYPRSGFVHLDVGPVRSW